MLKINKLLVSFALCIFLMPVAPQVLADPPPWAPAHGWRQKHDPNYEGYTGYTGRQWSDDYGISSGSCDRSAIATVLGGVVGGAIGSTIGKGNGRTVAIILGSVLGGVIGNKIGHDLDNADRGCLGQALELGNDRQRVTWLNEDNGLNYTVTPLSGFSAGGNKCRNYNLGIRGDDVNEFRHEKACLGRDGVWKAYRG